MGNLTTIVGNHAKAKILEAIALSDRPLSPSEIAEQANLGAVQSWYQHRDDLLSTVLEKKDKVGNSPIYGFVDSEKAEAVQTLVRKD
jgi:hypothetical protein